MTTEEKERNKNGEGRWRLVATALIGAVSGMILTGISIVWQRMEKISDILHEFAKTQAADNAKSEAQHEELKHRVDKLEAKERK